MPAKGQIERAAEQAVAVYEECRRAFGRMAQHVHDTILDRCDPGAIHTIEYRAKTAEKFRSKCLKQADGVRRYNDPLNEITDLAGVRVIVFVRDTVQQVCHVIGEAFDIIEQEDVGERVYKQGRFGYQSVHMLVSLDKRMYLGRERRIKRAVCEIQVRTVLQHAWAEMEHDIQYKGEQIPLDMAKRFSALAGLLEIADGEFQRIQTDSARLKESLQASLLDDLTHQGLTAQRQEAGTGSRNFATVQSVRDLVAEGRYDEALALYDQKIAAEPNSHTPLIGRAKLHFLMGHSAEALSDIDSAAELNGADPIVARTRNLIESGNLNALKSQGGIAEAERIQQGFAALDAGDGTTAFDIFAELEATGYNKAFALFNKAMACVVEEDLQGAREFLSSLKVIPTTPMSVSIRALQYIIAVMHGGEEAPLAEVARALAFIPHYSIEQSHLGHVLLGLSAKNPDVVKTVVDALATIGIQAGGRGLPDPTT